MGPIEKFVSAIERWVPRCNGGTWRWGPRGIPHRRPPVLRAKDERLTVAGSVRRAAYAVGGKAGWATERAGRTPSPFELGGLAQ